MDVYESGVKTDSIPLGRVNYNKDTSDDGLITFEYVLSDTKHKVIKLELNSDIFNTYDNTKILSSSINLVECTPQVQTTTKIVDYKSY